MQFDLKTGDDIISALANLLAIIASASNLNWHNWSLRVEFNGLADECGQHTLVLGGAGYVIPSARHEVYLERSNNTEVYLRIRPKERKETHK